MDWPNDLAVIIGEKMLCDIDNATATVTQKFEVTEGGSILQESNCSLGNANLVVFSLCKSFLWNPHNGNVIRWTHV